MKKTDSKSIKTSLGNDTGINYFGENDPFNRLEQIQNMSPENLREILRQLPDPEQFRRDLVKLLNTASNLLKAYDSAMGPPGQSSISPSMQLSAEPSQPLQNSIPSKELVLPPEREDPRLDAQGFVSHNSNYLANSQMMNSLGNSQIAYDPQGIFTNIPHEGYSTQEGFVQEYPPQQKVKNAFAEDPLSQKLASIQGSIPIPEFIVHQVYQQTYFNPNQEETQPAGNNDGNSTNDTSQASDNFRNDSNVNGNEVPQEREETGCVDEIEENDDQLDMSVCKKYCSCKTYTKKKLKPQRIVSPAVPPNTPHNQESVGIMISEPYMRDRAGRLTQLKLALTPSAMKRKLPASRSSRLFSSSRINAPPRKFTTATSQEFVPSSRQEEVIKTTSFGKLEESPDSDIEDISGGI